MQDKKPLNKPIYHGSDTLSVGASFNYAFVNPRNIFVQPIFFNDSAIAYYDGRDGYIRAFQLRASLGHSFQNLSYAVGAEYIRGGFYHNFTSDQYEELTYDAWNIAANLSYDQNFDKVWWRVAQLNFSYNAPQGEYENLRPQLTRSFPEKLEHQVNSVLANPRVITLGVSTKLIIEIENVQVSWLGGWSTEALSTGFPSGYRQGYILQELGVGYKNFKVDILALISHQGIGLQAGLGFYF